MWLLKLHVSFSILCMLTFWGFRKVFKEVIEKNGWKGNQKKKFVYAIWIFFIPVLNLLCVAVLFMMILTENEDQESGGTEGNKEENGA